jgi:ribosomal protein L11 methyltransferase
MHALTLVVAAAAVDPVSERLADTYSALSVSVEDADAGTAAETPLFDEPAGPAAGRWQRARIVALFAEEAGALGAAAGLVSLDPEAGHRIEAITPVDDLDWVRLTQSQFGPIEVEPDFWVVPSWSAAPPTARRVLRLDPGMAFGTGAHPTTRMCLRWIARAAASRASPWVRVLDYGCGSGILAIAAGLFGARSIDAVDIDPAAVETTRANALANGVRLRAGDAATVGGAYSLVVANILATPLRILAPLLASQLDTGADLLLSGILGTQADEVREAYAPWLPLRIAQADDGWILMTGVRE